MDTGARLSCSLPPPLATVCALLSVIEHQQGVIAQQHTRLEQLQSHLDQLRTTHEHQLQTLQEQQTQIDALKAEVARLKQLQKRPKIRPSTLPKDDEDPDQDKPDGRDTSDQGKTDDRKGKPPKPRKRNKQLTIHKTAYSAECCHRFRCESCHLIHVKPATHSGGKLPPVGAKRRRVGHCYSEGAVVVNFA